MERRLQEINGDTVLEITKEEIVVTRLSEKRLRERLKQIDAVLARWGEERVSVEAKIKQIEDEKRKAE